MQAMQGQIHQLMGAVEQLTLQTQAMAEAQAQAQAGPGMAAGAGQVSSKDHIGFQMSSLLPNHSDSGEGSMANAAAPDEHVDSDTEPEDAAATWVPGAARSRPS